MKLAFVNAGALFGDIAPLPYIPGFFVRVKKEEWVTARCIASGKNYIVADGGDFWNLTVIDYQDQKSTRLGEEIVRVKKEELK